MGRKKKNVSQKRNPYDASEFLPSQAERDERRVESPAENRRHMDIQVNQSALRAKQTKPPAQSPAPQPFLKKTVSRLSDLDEAEEDYKFELTWKKTEILSLQLIKMLPKSGDPVKLNFQNRIGYGPKTACLDFLRKVKAALTEKMMTKLESKTRIDCEALQIHILAARDVDCLVFGLTTINYAFTSLIANYHLEEELAVLRTKFDRDTIVLIWHDKAQQSILEVEIQNFEEKAMSESRLATLNLPPENQEAQRWMVVGRNVPPRQGRTQRPFQRANRQVLFEEIYKADAINVKHLKIWVERSRKIAVSDLEIKEILDERGILTSYHISLLSLYPELDRQKKEKLMIYFKFEVAVLIDSENKLKTKEIIKKYLQKSAQITVTVTKGFKSKRSRDLRRVITQNDFRGRPAEGYSIYFEAFLLVGLQPIVKRVEAQILQDLSNIPQEDETQDIFLDFPKISEHIYESVRLQQLISESTKTQLEKHKEVLQYKSINFKVKTPLLKVLVKQAKLQEFIVLGPVIKDAIISGISLHLYHYDKLTEKEKKIVLQFTSSKIIVEERDGLLLIEKKQLLGSAIQQIQKQLSKTNLNSTLSYEIKKIMHADAIWNHVNFQKNKRPNEFQQVNFNRVNEHSGSKIILHGPAGKIELLFKMCQELENQLSDSTLAFSSIIISVEAILINNSRELKKSLSNLDLYIQTKPIDPILEITISQPSIASKTLQIRKANSLDCAPIGSLVLFRDKRELKLFNAPYVNSFLANAEKISDKAYISLREESRHLIFIYHFGSFANILSSVQAQIVDLNEAQLVMIMPKKMEEKEQFLSEIVETFVVQKRLQMTSLNILIIEPDQDMDLKSLQKIVCRAQEGSIKYYVSDGIKFYYSKSGNTKINQALKRKQTEILLLNEDVNMAQRTHSCNLQNRKMVHLQSGITFPINFDGKKISFNLKGVNYDFPPAESARTITETQANPAVEVTVSIGLYRINLITMTQKNIFSGYERKVQMQMEAPVYPNCTISQDYIEGNCQYVLQFVDKYANNLIRGKEKVQQFLREQLRKLTIQVPQSIIEGKMGKIQEFMKARSILDYEIAENTITASSYNESDLKLFEADIEKLKYEMKQTSTVLKYPAEWEAQNEMIEVFSVASSTAQYAKVQAEFKISPIKELLRIQNKYMYRKYQQQLKHLTELNNGQKPLEMRLFHGTKQTPPEVIYADKEESFNINYSSENNLLGKGIYFAQEAKYSNDYRHEESKKLKHEKKVPFNIFLPKKSVEPNLYSMLLCTVVTGDSEKCRGHSEQIKDTGYKDTVNKLKYESMTDFLNNSNVFVVYKSQRAYPMYLIKYS